MRKSIVNAKIRWDQAIQEAVQEVRKVQDGVREADPQLADALDAVVSDYAGRLDVVAARCQKAKSPEELQQRLQEALDEVTALQAELEMDVVLEFLQEYPFEKVTVQSVFKSAIDDLNKQLAKAVG